MSRNPNNFRRNARKGPHNPAPKPRQEPAQDTTPDTPSTPFESGEPASDFASLELAPQLLRAIRDEGYEVPSLIQAQAIPPAMAGRDVLGCAQTGTGKTAAFALPVLDKLIKDGVAEDRCRHVPRALVLCPTRELAGQITKSFSTYGRHARLRHTAIYGGVSQFHQEKALRRGVNILVATPGRLIDLIEQGIVDLSEIEVFILDEADRMLDMGFINPIRRIAAEIHEDRQTMLFSATMPREIKSLANSLLNDPVHITVTPVASAAPKIEQSVYMVGRQEKQALLHHLIDEHSIERTLVFTRTKHGADKVARRLNRAGIAADAIHGNKSQNQRQRALDGFRVGKCRVLVATDVAARGLDIDDVSHVFNFDMPNEPEAYIHRIGRTGRAGATGLAIAFCDRDERSMLRQIERLLGNKIAATTELPVLPILPKAERGVESKPRTPRTPRGPGKPGNHSASAPRPPKRRTGSGSGNDYGGSGYGGGGGGGQGGAKPRSRKTRSSSYGSRRA
ncbi:MAG: DEAD/DEAH box helicase [Planctomycetota bacterium]|nr:DEAD/DEAH box helicase [Planctomycetota bacterium]